MMTSRDYLYSSSRYQRQSNGHLLVSNVYTAEMACEMTFVSSVASSEHGGRGETAGTYVVI